MQPEEQVRANIVEVGRRIYERGYVASNDHEKIDRLRSRFLATERYFLTRHIRVTRHRENPEI